jgi:DNA-binding Lrp family transcriptional regulator
MGYTAIVDEAAYGLPITAFVKIRLQRHDRRHSETIEQAIRDIDAVQDCYMMTGEADYLLRVLVGSLTEYEEFVRDKLHDVPGISAIDTSFAIGTVKRTTRFPRRRHIDAR